VADAKISALTAVVTPAGTDEFAVNQSATSKRMTLTQVATFTGTAIAAAQSDQETATSVALAVTPGRQQFHPSAAKFWVEWTGGTTTILASYNTTSIAATGTGDADVTIGTDFSSANWAPFVTGIETAGFTTAIIYSSGVNSIAAGTLGCNFGSMQDGGTAAGGVAEPDQWAACGFGDQA
jgi:hypothetical protein